MNDTPQARILEALRDAAPASLENVQAGQFGLADLQQLLNVLGDLRDRGFVDYRMVEYSGYDRVREIWLID